MNALARSSRRIAGACRAIILLGLCGAGMFGFCLSTVAAPVAAPASVKLTVSAAASLKDALSEITTRFEQAHTEVHIALNFGASGTLELQIEHGAPVDVFVSASKEQMDALSARNLLMPNTRVDLLQNELVLIVPRDSAGSSLVATFRDLEKPDLRVVAMGDPRNVPAGYYAEQVLRSLGIYDAVKRKATFATDVRQVLADVETGNADAGLVYATDASISPHVRVVAEAPAGSHEPIVYPAAVLRTIVSAPADAAAARAYLDFLTSSTARAIFTKYGFRPAKMLAAR